MSLGVPMLLMGDELRRTQRGNNNAYCQDNELSWLDWTDLEHHADIHRFVTLLNERRLLRDVENERQRTSLSELLAHATQAWHGIHLFQPDWSDNSHSLALCAELPGDGFAVHLVLNAYWEPLDFELPNLDNGRQWLRWIDTSLDSPHDIVPWQQAPPITDPTYRAGPRSVAMLWSQLE